MPTSLTLRLAEPAMPPYPAHLHGAACKLFEPPDADHAAQRKPFAVGAPLAVDGSAIWRLGWLLDAPPPTAWPPGQLLLGESTCPILDTQTRHVPFATLAASEPVTRRLVRFVTPTYFSRNGRDVPLPDPVLVFRSLAQRWNAFAPASLTINDELSRALVSAVLLSDASVDTVSVQVGRLAWQTGFVGDAEFGLTRTAAPGVAAVFAALSRFAAIAGVGAQTTHGFGEVSPELLDAPARTPRPRRPGANSSPGTGAGSLVPAAPR
jgi:CRISPR-associated endoribonuclease Cas6